MSSLQVREAIAGLALLSPWCDLREEAASIHANRVAHSPFNHQDSLEYSRMYLAGHHASDARVSPLLSANFEGLPSVYLEWALDEFLAPDITQLSKEMAQVGVELKTRMEPQAVHGWQLLPDFLPEAKRSTAALGDWVRIRLGLQGFDRGHPKSMTIPSPFLLRCKSMEGQGGTHWVHSRTRTKEHLGLVCAAAGVHGFLDGVRVFEFDGDECPEASNATNCVMCG